MRKSCENHQLQQQLPQKAMAASRNVWADDVLGDALDELVLTDLNIEDRQDFKPVAEAVMRKHQEEWSLVNIKVKEQKKKAKAKAKPKSKASETWKVCQGDETKGASCFASPNASVNIEQSVCCWFLKLKIRYFYFQFIYGIQLVALLNRDLQCKRFADTMTLI